MIDHILLEEIAQGKLEIEELEKIRTIHFRELYPLIDHTNFQICTKVDFKSVEIELGQNVRETFSRIRHSHSGVLLFEFKSKSGSEYFVTATGDVYRLSDHWGAVSSCEWSREGKGNFRMSEFITGELEIGVANLKDFRIFRRKDDRNVDKLLNPVWKEKMSKFASLRNALKSLIEDFSFKDRPLEEKQILGSSYGFFNSRLKDTI